MSQKTNTNTCEKCKDTLAHPIVHSVDVKINPDEDSSQSIPLEPEISNHHDNTDCDICKKHLRQDHFKLFCEYCGKPLPPVCDSLFCYKDVFCKYCEQYPPTTKKLWERKWLEFERMVGTLAIFVFLMVYMVSILYIDHNQVVRSREPANRDHSGNDYLSSSRISLNDNDYEILGWCKNDESCIKAVKNDEIYNIYVMDSETDKMEKYMASGSFKKGDVFKIEKSFLGLDYITNTRSGANIYVDRVCGRATWKKYCV